MSTLEREILEKFHQLEADAKQRVRALIEQETAAEFDYDAWFHKLEILREQIRANQGDAGSVDTVDILRAIRDGEDE